MIKWTESLTVRRTSTGEYIKGEWADGSSEEFGIKANVQPQSPSRLQLETNGRRIVEAIKIYTRSELFVETGEFQSDKVIYKGRVFEVHEVLSYDQNLRNKHFKAIAIRMNREDQGEQDGRF